MENIRLLCLPLDQFQDPVFYHHLFQHYNCPLTLFSLSSWAWRLFLASECIKQPALYGFHPLPHTLQFFLQLIFKISSANFAPINPFFHFLFLVFINRRRCYSCFSWLQSPQSWKHIKTRRCSTAGHLFFEFQAGFHIPWKKLPYLLKFSAKLTFFLKIWGVQIWCRFNILTAKHKCHLILKSSKYSFHLDVKAKVVWAENQVPKLWDHLWKFWFILVSAKC